jgi:hypothetical protein
MALDNTSGPERSSVLLHPVEARYAALLCFGLLTIASALASFAFACATPFAAFAVIAAATLPSQPALVVVTATWLVNQAIGFGFLHYPVDASTITWGFVIGAAALAATVGAASLLRATRRTGATVAVAAALFGAYAAYELVLFAATPFLGGAGDFTAAIVGRIGVLNVLWTIGLIAACEAIRFISALPRRQPAS